MAGPIRSTSSLAARCARELGFEEVSVSHELSPLARYVTRADTTVLNAYLAPPLAGYVRGLKAQLRALDPQRQAGAHAE